MRCKRDKKIIKEHETGEITHNKYVKSLMSQDGETGHRYYIVEKLLPNGY